jgi:tetratricopeptide (TPR) repeat protein
VANSLANLGSLLRDAGRLAEAEPLLAQALDIRRALYGDGRHETLVSLNKLALLRRAQGRSEEARQLFEQYVAGVRDTLGEQHAHVAVGLTNLGLVLYDEADYLQAEQCFRQAERVFRQTRGDAHPQVAEALINLGNALRMQGRRDEAAAECARALNLLASADPRRARGLLLRGELLCDAGEAEAARPVLEEAQRICVETYGAEHAQSRRVAAALRDCGLSPP